MDPSIFDGQVVAPIAERKCENCRFFYSGGECRRRAPVVVTLVPGDASSNRWAQFDGIFPHTHSYWWCGEWAQK